MLRDCPWLLRYGGYAASLWCLRSCNSVFIGSSSDWALRYDLFRWFLLALSCDAIVCFVSVDALNLGLR